MFYTNLLFIYEFQSLAIMFSRYLFLSVDACTGKFINFVFDTPYTGPLDINTFQTQVSMWPCIRRGTAVRGISNICASRLCVLRKESNEYIIPRRIPNYTFCADYARSSYVTLINLLYFLTVHLLKRFEHIATLLI